MKAIKTFALNHPNGTVLGAMASPIFVMLFTFALRNRLVKGDEEWADKFFSFINITFYTELFLIWFTVMAMLFIVYISNETKKQENKEMNIQLVKAIADIVDKDCDKGTMRWKNVWFSDTQGVVYKSIPRKQQFGWTHISDVTEEQITGLTDEKLLDSYTTLVRINAKQM